MKISLVCFTRAGAGLCVRLIEGLSKSGDVCEANECAFKGLDRGSV